jgi:hypothetical protein
MAWEEDPIVTEVRQIRTKLMEDAGGFEAYIKKLQQQELEHPERMIDKENLNEASTRT